MPRIQGVGELDWSFPNPLQGGIISEAVFEMLIEMRSLPRTVAREEASYGRGQRTEQELLRVIPPVIAYLAEKLSQEVPKRFVHIGFHRDILPGPDVILLRLYTGVEYNYLKHPTKFLNSLARKMSKWAAEWRKTQILEKGV